MRRVLVLLAALTASLAAGQENDSGMGLVRTPPPKLDAKSKALLNKIREVYRTTRTARMRTTFEEVRESKRVRLTSECSYQAPTSFRIVSHGLARIAPSGYVLVTDGKKIRVDGLPGGTSMTAFDRRQMRRNLPHVNLEVMCFYDWQRQLSRERGGFMHGSTFRATDESWNGKMYSVLEETNKMQGVRVKYFTDPKTGLIWRTEQYSLDGSTPYMVTTIDSMEVNVPIDPATFKVPELNPPKA